MVAITHDHLFEMVELVFRRAHQAVFVEHQHAQPVAGIEQFGRGRIVRTTIGVAAKCLQVRDAEILKRIGKGRTHPSVVLVVVGAFQFDVLAVQEKTMVGVEPYRADPEGCFITVHHGAAGADRGDEFVQMGRFDGPEPGIGNLHHAGKFAVVPGLEPGLPDLSLCDRLAVRIQNGLLDIKGGVVGAFVDDRDARGDVGGIILHLGCDKRAIVADVQRTGLDQPDVAIDARALVKPAFLHCGVHAHSDDLLPP